MSKRRMVLNGEPRTPPVPQESVSDFVERMLEPGAIAAHGVPRLMETLIRRLAAEVDQLKARERERGDVGDNFF